MARFRFRGIDRTHTRRSCLGNAAVAFALAVFMVICMFVGSVDAETQQNLLIGGGILAAVGLYWVYRWYKFDDQDFNDPLHLKH